MHRLTDMKIAIIATDGVEEAELTKPLEVLREAGAQVDILGLRADSIQAFRGMEKGSCVPVDHVISEVYAAQYDALLLPGGALNADKLRVETAVLDFVRQFDQTGKPIAAICHAPWILVSAGLTQGRTLTSFHTIQDDIRNSGATWIDSPAVVDRNWLTSRQPGDIPAFNAKLLELFGSLTPAL